ncbi:hypothetical protein [Bergeyella zoohelcum]|uniref:Uncharacterized protein n=1 Tax=Bergeyella zoohelcum TaxID=1015 RepID=A0A376BYD6_9FLAO|nr:hypothetical protein [Bergeyella zoohelcum]EKB61262.1 hypothetical protein HMPREF9700_00757 [Bergeyella zoohelcum CCUG 30536]MDY6024989.1 hypothetical protein [Bergeyella zoohelcum]SSZ46646.1 Uncharacterised protein [Bergeyella zoohelcum]
MEFLRNTFAVLLGLAVAAGIITLGIRMNPNWVTFDEFSPFRHWRYFLTSMKDKNDFFASLLVFTGVGSIVGGVCTAVIVRYAKVAYAILIGFILLFIAVLDIIFNPFHPVFYKISIFLTFFPFAWVGGKIVEVMYNKRSKR